MTDRFLAFIPFIFEWETEYNKDGSVRTEHDPDDPGGTTRFGIDQRSHPDVDIENLTKEQATDIYWTYPANGDGWYDLAIDSMAEKLGEAYFNAVVNNGISRANKLLALANNDPAQFVAQHADFYKRLAASRPSMQKYLKGWLNRLGALRDYLQIT